MRDRFYLILIAIFLLYSLTLTGKLSTGGDDANYIILSISLASAQGYRIISHPDQPLETQYPPLLSFLLMPLVRFFPENYLILKLIPLFFSFGTILIFIRIAKMLLPQKAEAMLLVILVAISPILVYYSTQVLSEPLYVFFSLFSIYLALRFDTQEDRRELLALPLAALAAYYSRSIGLSLIISIMLLYLIRRRYKIFFFLSLLMVLLILPWIIRNSLLLGKSPYISSFFLVDPYNLDLGTIGFIGFGKRFVMNIIRYSGKIILNLLAYPWLEKVNPYNPFKIALGLIISSFILFGFYRSLKTKINLLNLYALIYLLFCLVWPWYDTRFLVPIFPIILLFLIQGINEVEKLLKIKPLKNVLQRKLFHKMLIASIILFFLIGSARIIYNNHWGEVSEEWQDYHRACLWLKEHSANGSNILCREPSYAYLISERKAVCYPFTLNHDEMSQFFVEHRIDYIIYDRLIAPTDNAQRYLKPFLASHPELFRPVYPVGSSGTYVFKWVGVMQ